MPLTPIPYDPQHADLFRPLNNSRWEKVIYWKAPDLVRHTGEPYSQAGWIQPRDSSDTAAIGFMRTGWTPLDQFGSTGPDSKNHWHNILTHPEGRALFPLSQILAYHWHRVTNLRHDWPTLPAEYQQDAQLARLFPQLREPGLRIQEFGCPNCHNRVFLEPQGLFQHMTVHHSMKPEDIFAWGRQMGIDFGDRLRDRSVVTITFDDLPEEPPEEVYASPVIETAGAGVPIPESVRVAREKAARVEAARRGEPEYRVDPQ
jgi:hypothetical protein